ncbi:MAG TPA: Wzz/FepE/Etk N-terminal domain-containing protein [Blastocatellia bacterium]|nr:Wzz/FepE/Etk N-terminal domain-containing protein [Blastocatellia bacterium]
MSSYRPRSLSEYAQVIWRRRLLFFLIAAILLISTFIVIARMPDLYQSTASVVVAGKQEDRQIIASRVTTITERINSRSFLEPLIERHGLYSSAVARGAIESAVNSFRKDIKLSTKYRGDNPEMLTITYRHTDPETAKNVATDLVSTFDRMNNAVEQRMTEQANNISTEIAQIDERLNQLGQQRAISASLSRAASSTRGAFNEIRAQRAAAQSSVETLVDKQFVLEQQIAEQKRQIAEQEKLAKASPRDARSGSSYGVLLVRKAELEAQLKDYQAQYTDKNPKMIQTQNQIAEINRQLAELGSGQGAVADSSESRELRSLQRELVRMQTEMTIVQRELGRKQQTLSTTPRVAVTASPVVSSDSSIPNIAVETDAQRLRDRYTLLLRQQDTLDRDRLTAAGLEPGVFQIIDLPAMAESPSGPDRTKLRLLALAAALAIAFIVVAAIEFPRLYAIRDERDIDYYLGTRVVALIPESLTPQERGLNRRVLLMRRVGVLAVAVLLVPGLVFLLNYLRIIHIFANRW